MEHEKLIRADLTVRDLHEALAEWLYENGLEMEKAAKSIVGCDFSLLDGSTTDDLVDEARAVTVYVRPVPPGKRS